MRNWICPQCGESFTERAAYRRHYLQAHPDEPFPELWDSPDQDQALRSGGDPKPSGSDRPVNVFEDVMEEPPEGDEEAAAGI